MRILSCMMILIFACLCTACDNDENTRKKAMGEECYDYSECETGVCMSIPVPASGMRCTMQCYEGEPCPDEWTCVEVEPGTSLCSMYCSAETFMYNYFVCIDGVPTTCPNAPYGVYCTHCGCNEEDFCSKGFSDTFALEPPACLTKRALGEFCKEDGQCESGNCSLEECRSEIGSSCNSDDPCDCNCCCICSAPGYCYCHLRCDPDDATSCPSGQECTAFRDSWGDISCYACD